MIPSQRYQSYLQSGKLIADATQQEIVAYFDVLFHHLNNQYRQRFLSRIYRSVGIKQIPVKGLYLWGDVGRGKTFLMDLFFHSLPFTQKTRLHFHRFMNYVHHAMHDYQGHKDPLKHIAREFANHSIVLCFDELYVSDIADAMILSELFHHLFEAGVTLVATSNLPPQDLYLNGLQRDKFLPTISLINQHTKVMEIKGALDYRLQNLTQSQIYHYPLNDEAERNLSHYFQLLAPEQNGEKTLIINERSLATIDCADGVVWFTFETLCQTARSAMDYVEIARCFHTVLLSGVKEMGPQREDAARRFISLIDELYDHQVKLIISAQAPLLGLYKGERHVFEFQRTISRLTEMQSEAYLAKPHLP